MLIFLDKTEMFIPLSMNLFVKLEKCCEASNVVGTSTQVCLLFKAAMKAALIATSVLPNPTSPQINLSIGISDFISVITSSIVLF